MTIRRHQVEADEVERLGSRGNAYQYEDPAEEMAIWALWDRFGVDVSAIDDWLLSDGWDAAAWRSVVDRRDRMLRCMQAGNDEGAQAWGEFLHERMRRDKNLKFLQPLARRGKKFAPGSKGSKPTPLRAAIARALYRDDEPTNETLWARFVARPPKHLHLYETERLGRYVETDGAAQTTSWRRFCNIVSEERRKMFEGPTKKR